MRRKIVAFYTPKQVLKENIEKSNSKSPLKPMLVMSDLMKVANKYVRIQPKFKPFTEKDFCIAHYPEYVEEVFNFNQPGRMLPSSIPWSEQLVTSLTYTSSSLYHAIKHSIKHPEDLAFSPTSGFHHARPTAGSGYCTFAGQVIASVKILKETGLAGCYLDLDGHFGNSIEDCRKFTPELNRAVPVGFNFNPQGYDKAYTNHFEEFLYGKLTQAILKKEIGYVVWCHGADSHEDDDLGGQVDTKHWKLCSKLFWNWVKYMEEEMGVQVPVSFALFGGYRRDAYQSVINLHISDIVTGINILIPDAKIDYKLEYAPSTRYNAWKGNGKKKKK